METQLFIGGLTRIDDAGQSTGIYKRRVAESILLTSEGFVGDVQADRRVHGGPEKAVHHYAAENYARLAEHFPTLAAQLIPGSIGENVSTCGWDEHKVCIGDTFRLGDTLIQVSQPRSPCWKIDHRYATDGIARRVAETGLTGWYYRVLAAGTVTLGSALEFVDRPPNAIALSELWETWRQHRPALEALRRISAAPGLTPAWRKKLIDRYDWLRANPDAAAPRCST